MLWNIPLCRHFIDLRLTASYASSQSSGHRREVEAQPRPAAVATRAEGYGAQLGGVRVDEVAGHAELVGDAAGIDPRRRRGVRVFTEELDDTARDALHKLVGLHGSVYGFPNVGGRLEGLGPAPLSHSDHSPRPTCLRHYPTASRAESPLYTGSTPLPRHPAVFCV